MTKLYLPGQPYNPSQRQWRKVTQTVREYIESNPRWGELDTDNRLRYGLADPYLLNWSGTVEELVYHLYADHKERERLTANGTSTQNSPRPI